MRDYKTRGTPWTIIIDPQGMIRFSAFHTSPENAIKMIDGFGKKAAEAPAEK
jgi:hypothetical protein